MRARMWLRKFLRDQKGNALVIGAATLPLVIGAAAIGVDTVQMSLARRQLQRTADSAALAGGHALVQSANVNTSVSHDLTLNNNITLASTLIENAPTSGPFANNNRAVRVRLTAQRAVPFMSFFTGSSVTMSAEATAAVVFAGEFCMVSLENSATEPGITFSGSTQVNLGCGVATNSRAAAAISAGGSAQVTASPIAAVGGVPSSSSYQGETTILPYSPPQDDPYANLPTPTVPSNCQNKWSQNPNQTPPAFVPSSPGVYCYRGMDFKGTVTLPPNSVFIIDANDLAFGAQANVTGEGVTFILTSSNATSNPASIAKIDMHGGAVVNFTAPDSGPYSGVLMYQDRRAPYADSHINGNSASSYRGGFYFPSQRLTFNGNTGMRTQCMQLVARRLVFSGNSSVQNTCPEDSGSQAFDATFVRLVG